MTLFIVLLYGLGTSLVVSGFETDPKTGKPVSIVQTIQDIWNSRVSLHTAAPTTKPVPSGAGGAGGSMAPVLPDYAGYRASLARTWLASQQR